jgi:hypothetical protein
VITSSALAGQQVKALARFVFFAEEHAGTVTKRPARHKPRAGGPPGKKFSPGALRNKLQQHHFVFRQRQAIREFAAGRDFNLAAGFRFATGLRSGFLPLSLPMQFKADTL